MPPKKARTPRIRAFKHIPITQPAIEDDGEEEEEDPLQDIPDSKPKRVIITANVAAARERQRKKMEKAQSAEENSTDTTPVPKSSAEQKTKQAPSTNKATTASETSDDIKPVKKKPKPAKDKQTPGTSGVQKTPATKSKSSKVKLPKSSKNEEPQRQSKTKKGATVTVTKSGKAATSKRSVGNKPADHDTASETPAPEEEPDYFASSDEDARQAQIDIDAAMARALAEDAEDSPLELDWTRRKWTPSEDEAIIEHVKSNQIYYNMRRTDFKEKDIKDSLWKPLEKRFKVPGKHYLFLSHWYTPLKHNYSFLTKTVRRYLNAHITCYFR